MNLKKKSKIKICTMSIGIIMSQMLLTSCGQNTTLLKDTNKVVSAAKSAQQGNAQSIKENNNNAIDSDYKKDINNSNNLSNKMDNVQKESDEIIFKDKNLENAIREGLPKLTGNILVKDVINIKSLSLSGRKIADIAPLRYFKNLKQLDLSRNSIDDFKPLTYLENLEGLDISDMEVNIKDISFFKDFKCPEKMKYLLINMNSISDIEPLSKMINLENLELQKNQIEDISPLNALKSLITLDLSNNKIKNIEKIKNLNSINYVSLGREEIDSLEKSEIVKKQTIDNSVGEGDSVENKLNNYYFKAEDENYIYYSWKEGIRKINKKNGEDKLILEGSNIHDITLSAGSLYFSQNTKNGEDSGIFRMDTNGKNCVQLFHRKQSNTGMEYNIHNFSVKGDTLYLSSAMQLYSYNMNTKKTTLLLDDAEKFYVVEDSIYYMDHVGKTFTIYKKNLKTMKDEIVLGDGEGKRYAKPGDYGILYSNFLFIGDKMYYSTRNPNGVGVYDYKDGNSEAISDTNIGNISDLLEYKRDLYYVETINDKSNKSFEIKEDRAYRYTDSKLMKFDTKSHSVLQVAVLKDYLTGGNIVDGNVYYVTHDNEIKGVKK